MFLAVVASNERLGGCKDFRPVRHEFTLRGIYNMLVGNPVLAEELKAIGKDDVFGTNVSYLSGRAPAPFREGMAGTVKKRSCC